MSSRAFFCHFEDDDPLVRACAPEQPQTVAAGQEWMEIATGNVLPVQRVKGDYIDLGHTSYTVVLTPEKLRAEWVCIDLPPLAPVADISRAADSQSRPAEPPPSA